MAVVQFDTALLQSQPQWVWVLGAAALLAVAWRMGFLKKFAQKPKVSLAPKGKVNVTETMLPPEVVKMKAANAAMKAKLAAATEARTKEIVEEYTKLMTLCAGAGVADSSLPSLTPVVVVNTNAQEVPNA